VSGLILASTSRYRRQLLERLGVPFTCTAPRCDEELLKVEYGPLPPRELAERLAEAKARSVAAEWAQAVVIGSDQLAHLDGDILGKPGSRAAAVDQLRRLSGRTHELITAVVIVAAGRVLRHTDTCRLTMRTLDDAALTRYVAVDDPVDCAGAYKLEARGIALFDRIDAADHSAITGLPLMALTGMLAGLGLVIP